MNRALVDRIANAVLYEGYILYPYRPSVKNRQRWTFGGLYPESYCQAQRTGDASSHQTQCLVRGDAATVCEAAVRFLHLTARTVGEVAPPLAEWPRQGEPAFRPVPMLRVGEQLLHAWQEAEEREVTLGDVTLGELAACPRHKHFQLVGGRRSEPVLGTNNEVAGILVREQQPMEGAIEAEATETGDGLFRLTLRVVNRTALPEAEGVSRDDALLRSLVSAHTILGVRGGAFVSLLEPPDECREATAACKNVGVWPVLVGVEGQTDTMLASPIILYDYPQIAPESPGDFFDGAEIDEMLTLRILTLTDDEKQAMAAVDERARGLLARTENLGPEQLLGLHGTIRALRPVPEEETHG
jgi:hydrogenase maturation protease